MKTVQSDINAYVINKIMLDNATILGIELSLTINKTECPKFMQYLNEVLPDVESQNILAEYCGYTLTNGLNLKKALLLLGDGANGKSVFFDVLNAILGKENITFFQLSELENPLNRVHLQDALVNYCSELNGNVSLNLAQTLISNEPISVKELYNEAYDMTDYAKFVFDANTLPSNIEHNEAFLKHLIIVHFNVAIPQDKRNPSLASDIISSELGCVLNWMMDGLKRLVNQGGFSKCTANHTQSDN